MNNPVGLNFLTVSVDLFGENYTLSLETRPRRCDDADREREAGSELGLGAAINIDRPKVKSFCLQRDIIVMLRRRRTMQFTERDPT